MCIVSYFNSGLFIPLYYMILNFYAIEIIAIGCNNE